MTYECPVCKHSEVKYDDKEPVKVVSADGESWLYYLSICDNCENVYCYKDEIMKKEEIKNE